MRTVKRSRASLIILIVLAFLLMTAAIVLAVSLPDDGSWRLPSDTSETGAIQLAGFDCTASEALQLYPFASGVLHVTPHGVAFLDMSGSETWSSSLAMASPFAVRQGAWMLVGDRDGHAYAMFGDSGLLYSGTATGRIIGLALSRDGQAALVQDQLDSTGIVTVLEALTGTKQYDCHFPESGYVLSVSFTSDGTAFDVSLANTDGSSVKPVIKRYSAAGQEQGQILPDLDSLYPLIVYDASGHPVICSTTNLAALDYGKDTPVWQHAFDQVFSAETTGSGLLVLASGQAGGKPALYLLDDRGESRAGPDPGDVTAGPAVFGNLAVLGSGKHLKVINLATLDVIREAVLDDEIIRCAFSGSQTVVAVTRSGVRGIPVQEP